jgi:hypothetical protein
VKVIIKTRTDEFKSHAVSPLSIWGAGGVAGAAAAEGGVVGAAAGTSVAAGGFSWAVAGDKVDASTNMANASNGIKILHRFTTNPPDENRNKPECTALRSIARRATPMPPLKTV